MGRCFHGEAKRLFGERVLITSSSHSTTGGRRGIRASRTIGLQPLATWSDGLPAFTCSSHPLHITKSWASTRRHTPTAYCQNQEQLTNVTESTPHHPATFDLPLTPEQTDVPTMCVTSPNPRLRDISRGENRQGWYSDWMGSRTAPGYFDLIKRETENPSAGRLQS